MKIEAKKTSELSQTEIEQYGDCYTKVYERPTSSDNFLREYQNTCLGYSIHVLLYNEGNVIVGAYSLVPFLYEVNKEKKLFAYAAGLMIEKEYRGDFGNLYGLVRTMLKVAKKQFSCIYIFPNDNADIVNKQLIKADRIGELDTYFLPYKIGSFKSSFKILNPLSKFFSRSLLFLSNLKKKCTEIKLPIFKSRNEFVSTRLKWSNYTTYEDKEMTATWKVTQFEGIEAAFLIDVFPFSEFNFEKAVREMFKTEKDKVGLFIYVGLLQFHPISMIKVPKKFAPKKFRFDIKLFDDSIPKDLIENPYNWDINLSSYDLL